MKSELPAFAKASAGKPAGLTLIFGGGYNLNRVGVNWIRRGSRGCRGMPSCPRLVKIVELNITADNQLALAA